MASHALVGSVSLLEVLWSVLSRVGFYCKAQTRLGLGKVPIHSVAGFPCDRHTSAHQLRQTMTHLKENVIYITVRQNKKTDQLQKNVLICEHVICTIWVMRPDTLVVSLQSGQALGGFSCGSSGDGNATLNASAKRV